MIRIESPNNLCRHWLIFQLIKKIPFNRFLEIGVGNGVFLKKLAKRGYCGKGIDVSEEAISITSAGLKGYKNIAIEKKDFFEVNEKFDLIIMLQVLEHIQNDFAALNKVKELLENKGYLILSIPAHKNKWGYNDIIGGHYRRYEKKDLENLLDKIGLEIIYCWTYAFPINNLLRPWEELFYKQYFIKQNLNRKSLKERTQASGLIKIPWVLGFPKIFKIFINETVFFPFLILQKLFLNTNWGLNYLILARTG